MIKTVFVSLLAILLFSLGAAGSWYFLKQQDQAAAEVQQQEPQPADNGAVPEKPAAVALPTAVFAEGMSADETFRLEAMYSKQREDLIKWQQRLETSEQRLKLMGQDLVGQRREIDGLLVQVQEQLAAAEKVLVKLNQQSDALSVEREQLDKQLEEIKSQQAAGNDTALKDRKKSAGLLETMAPEKAAEIIRGKMNRGEFDSVTEMLKLIEERNASKILEALPENMLDEIFDRMAHRPQVIGR